MGSFFGRISSSGNIFLYSSLLVFAVFLITRLQYFLYYPVLVLSSDSASYCAVAFDILDFKTPVFDIRTPGYPLFLALVWSISKTVYANSLAQSIFTLLVSLFFVWAISKTYKRYTLLFAIPIAGFISSSYYLVLEDAILTEGIFVSMLLLSSALMILSLKKRSVFVLALFSASVALTILIRPAGIFMIGVMLVICVFFLFNKFRFKFYAALFIPFAFVILSLCTYNYFTLRLFTITPFGEANLSGVTVLFMEPSPEYPDFVNKAIQNTLDSIPRSDINYVKNSRGISQLYHTFNNNFYRQINLSENLMQADPSLGFTGVQPIIRKISLDAIKNNPKVYGKFVLCNFMFFFNNVKIVMNYYEQLSNILKRTYIDRKYTNELESGRWRQISSDKSGYENIKAFFEEETSKQGQLEYVTINEEGKVEFRQTFLKSLYETYEIVYNFFFRNYLWLIIYAAVFIISVIKLVKSRITNIDALIPFLFCMIFLFKAILVSMVEVSLARYSFTVEFVVYNSLPFLFILLKKPKQNLANN